MNDFVNEFCNDMKGKGYNESHCLVFYYIVENLYDFQTSIGCSKYDLDDDTCVVNPFYESCGRFEANPIDEYGDEFYNSNFIELLDKIKAELGENPTQENMNLCAARNIGEIQSYNINKYATIVKKPIEMIIDLYLEDLIFIEVDNIKVINPFENGKLIEKYKDLYLKSKFADILIEL